MNPSHAHIQALLSANANIARIYIKKGLLQEFTHDVRHFLIAAAYV